MINCAKKFQFCSRVAIPECNIGSVTYGSGWFGHKEINSVKNNFIAGEPSACCWFQSIWNLLLSDSEAAAALAVTCHPASRKSLLPLHAEGKFEGRHPDRRTDRETAGSPALWSWNNRHLLTAMLHCSDTTKRGTYTLRRKDRRATGADCALRIQKMRLPQQGEKIWGFSRCLYAKHPVTVTQIHIVPILFQWPAQDRNNGRALWMNPRPLPGLKVQQEPPWPNLDVRLRLWSQTGKEAVCVAV